MSTSDSQRDKRNVRLALAHAALALLFLAGFVLAQINR
jgi:hypothetical protein